MRLDTTRVFKKYRTQVKSILERPWANSYRKKIFCIGFNKTGTMSLSYFFGFNDIFSLHDPSWPNYSRTENGRVFINNRGDAFADGEQADFVRLISWYPDALFILNTRQDRFWIRSRIKHVMRFNENVQPAIIEDDPKYGLMAREFYCSPELAIRKWIAEKSIYESRVRTYFSGKNNFMEIDITQHNQWQEAIFAFMQKNGYRRSLKRPSERFSSRNKRHDDFIENREVLERYYALAEAILAPMSPSRSDA